MKRGTPEHPKIIEFSSLLKVPRYAAVGLLELLWHFTAEFAPQGDIGKHSDRAIAHACFWQGDASRFVDALVSARLVWKSDGPSSSRDGVGSTHPEMDLLPSGPRLLVWDWDDHADDYTRKKLQRKGLAILRVQKSLDNSRLPVPVPVPVPEPKPEPHQRRKPAPSPEPRPDKPPDAPPASFLPSKSLKRIPDSATEASYGLERKKTRFGNEWPEDISFEAQVELQKKLHDAYGRIMNSGNPTAYERKLIDSELGRTG